MKKEHRFVLDAVLIYKNDAEIELLDKAIDDGIDSFDVAGIIMNHRLGGYLYKGLGWYDVSIA